MAKVSVFRRLILWSLVACAVFALLAIGYALHFIYIADSKPNGRFARQANEFVLARSNSPNLTHAAQSLTDVRSIAAAVRFAIDQRGEESQYVNFVGGFDAGSPAKAKEATLATYNQLLRDGVVAQARSLTSLKGTVLLASEASAMRSQDGETSLRSLSKLLVMDFRVSAQRGDDAGAISAVQALLTINDVHLQSALWKDHLSAMAATASAFRSIGDSLADKHISEKLCNELLGVLVAWCPARSQADLMALERLEALDCIDTLYEPGPRGRLLLRNTMQLYRGPSAAMPRSRRDLEGLWHPRRKIVEQAAAEIAQFGKALSEAPLATPEREAIVPPARLETGHFWPASFFEVVIVYHDSLQVYRAALVTMLALELHRSRTGKLPATLDELVPSELAALPANISAPDRTFIYTVEGDDYTLYTTGPSGVDNQAQEFPEGTQAPYRHGAITQTQASQDWDYVFHRAAKKQTKSAAP